MKIQKSAEDYLEMILMLNEKKGYVRSVDIATGLAVSKPSVSVAMKHLREGGYITMDRDSYIALTDAGLDIARHIYDRDKALTQALIRIGVNPDTAEADACKVEHDISDETYEAVLRQLARVPEQRE